MQGNQEYADMQTANLSNNVLRNTNLFEPLQSTADRKNIFTHTVSIHDLFSPQQVIDLYRQG